MSSKTKEKPSIYQYRGMAGPFWICRMRGTIDGCGISPKEAYLSWVRGKGDPRIDLGRYAGTYGGTRPDRDVSIYASWWLSICEYSKQFVIGALIAAAATLWVASWMFIR